MPVAELERVWQRLRRADDPLPDALTEAAESAGDSDNTQTAIGARGANNCAVALFIGAIWYGRRIVDSKGRVASWSQPIKPQAGRI